MASTTNSQAVAHVKGTLSVQLPDLTVVRIDDVQLDIIKRACPVLFHVFEEGLNGLVHGSIEAPSCELVSRFLDYLKTENDYINLNDDSEVRSLLLHVQMKFMAQNFDVPKLETAAQLNFTYATELSCCVPDPPQDLSQAIAFIYKHLPSDTAIVQTLVHSCVNNYQYHQLNENEAFRNVVMETPDFDRDLRQASMNRDFQDAGAAAIVRMDICHPTPFTNSVLQKRALGDDQYDYWSDAEALSDADFNVDHVPPKRRKTGEEPALGLAHRPKVQTDFAEADPSSIGGDFTMVHRPKLTTTSATASPTEDDVFSPDADWLKDYLLDYDSLVNHTDSNDQDAASPTASLSSDWSLL